MKKILKICAIMSVVLIAFAAGLYFYLLNYPSYSGERNLFSSSYDIKRVVIEDSNPSIHEVFVLDSVNDVAVLKENFSRASVHMGEGEEDYRINFINDFTIHNIPFPDLFSQDKIDMVNSFIRDESKKYQK